MIMISLPIVIIQAYQSCRGVGRVCEVGEGKGVRSVRGCGRWV